MKDDLFQEYICDHDLQLITLKTYENWKSHLVFLYEGIFIKLEDILEKLKSTPSTSWDYLKNSSGEYTEEAKKAIEYLEKYKDSKIDKDNEDLIKALEDVYFYTSENWENHINNGYSNYKAFVTKPYEVSHDNEFIEVVGFGIYGTS